MEIVRIWTLDNGVPSAQHPREGFDYAVLEGNPSDGELIRVTSGQDVMFQRYTAPGPAPQKPAFSTLSRSQFIGVMVAALGRVRCDDLWGKSKTIEMAISGASTIDRNAGNFPALLTEIMAMNGGLTAQELAAVEAVWKAV